MYDPKVARFLQEDTYTGDVSDPLSLNLYTYGHNNPIKYYDPTGHAVNVVDPLTGALYSPEEMNELMSYRESVERYREELTSGPSILIRFTW